jgi:hypothetical protein
MEPSTDTKAVYLNDLVYQNGPANWNFAKRQQAIRKCERRPSIRELYGRQHGRLSPAIDQPRARKGYRPGYADHRIRGPGKEFQEKLGRLSWYKAAERIAFPVLSRLGDLRR